MNESVKMKYLDDFTEDLTEINKLNQKNNKISANELSQKNKAMTIQTTLTVEKTINKLRDVENFKI
jgi:glycine cleavage system protein P-like pyridoxal-binding family